MLNGSNSYNIVNMKKILMLFLAFLLSVGFVFSQTRNIGVGIIADGKPIVTSSNQALSMDDIKWSIKLVKSECIVKGEDCVFLPWIDDYNVNQWILAFDLNEFTFPCGAWAVGDEIEVSIEVTNMNHPFAGYKGSTTFTAPQVDRDYWDSEGINLTSGPVLNVAIDLNSLTFCQGAASGNTLTATVTNAEGAYTVTWLAGGAAIPGLSTSGTGNSVANFSGVAAGTYNVVAKVGNVESAPATVTVKPLPTRPTVAANPTSVCKGEEITVSVQAPQTGVTYAWTPTPKTPTTGSSALFDAVSNSVKYSVIPTLNGCPGTKSNEVTVTLKPDLIAQTPNITCKVDHYEASVTVNGTGNFDAFTDAGCTTLAVNASWSGNTVKLTDLTFGAHTYYLKGDNTCGVVTVPVNDNGSCACGAHLAIAMPQGNEFCEGTTAKPIVITLTRTAEFKNCSFQLKGPDGDVVLPVNKETKTTWNYTPTKSGTYTLENFIAYDAEGNSCGEIDGSGQVTVAIHPKPTLNSFIVSKTEGCYDEDLHLEAVAANGTGAYEYIWTGAGVTGKASTVDMKIQAGENTYTVQAKDAKGCLTEVSEAKKVLGHRVVVTASATPQTIVNGASTTLGCEVNLTPMTNTVDKYVWQPQDKIEGGTNEVKSPKTVNLTENQEYTVVVTDNHGCTGSDKVAINVSGSKLAVTAKGGTECYGTTLTLGCTPTGGAGNGNPSKYEYEWKPGAGLVLSRYDVPSPTVDPTTLPGSYKASVTVKDGTSEVTSAEVDVIVKEQPKLTNILATPSSGTNTVTSNLTVVVTPSDDSRVAVAWSPADKIASGVNSINATTQLLSESQTFTVRASLDGCFDEKTVNVVVVTQDLSLTATGSEGCAGTQLTVEANPSGGAPGAGGKYDYKWGNSTPVGIQLSSTTVKKPTIQNSASLTPGTYSVPVTVTDSKGQSKQANAVVTIYGAVVADGAGICKDADTFDGQITLSNGEVPYTIYSDAGATTVVTDVVWNADKTVATLENLTSGRAYTYYVKDKNGCNTKRVDLTADCTCGAQLVMTKGDKVCAQSGEDIRINLLASGGKSYSFDLVNVELGTKVLEVKNETATSWHYDVKYADRGKYRVDNFVAVTAQTDPGTCEGNVVPKEVEVQFYPTPKVEAGEDLHVCGTDPIVLRANGDAGLTYTWDNGVQDGVAFNPPMGVPTTYTVRGTDANGCWKDDQVLVTANFKPEVKAMATPNVICKGEVVNLSHNGTADEYTWDNNGQDGPNNIPETTTRYTVTGTSATTRCSDTSSVLVIVNLPAEIVERPKDRTIAIGKNVTYSVKAIGNNLTYEWLWYNPGNGTWTLFADNTATSPKVSGATTASLLLEEVPQAWDGRKVKCVVKGDCGDPMEAEANLWVKECFDIVADLQMGEGIRPETTPGSDVDGWYCKGNRISLKALVDLADPENGTVANPHYTWTIDGLPATKVFESDSSVLSWVPEYYEDDIVVKVCVYSDGACDAACSRHLRLKARTPDDVRMQIVTSVDPDRMFCPGDSVDFTVALKNEGRNADIHWYRDIFDKGTGRSKTFVMDQKDTWVKAVFVPSEEMCIEREISDSVFLKVKEYVNPTLVIENNIQDTVACQGDTLLFHAIWSDAGTNPEIQWQQDIWNRGTGEYAIIGLNDKDTWVKCVLTPGKDVCYNGPIVTDTMVIRVRETGTLTIAVDMTDKHPGDELVFDSKIEGMTGTWKYNWYVNGNQTTCEEDSYITDLLRQGDIVDASISGNEVCLSKIFSNQIRVNYAGFINRDTMLVIYRDEKVTDLDMVKEGDVVGDILFRVDIPASFGMASFSPDGKFTYLPNSGFVGTDYVKYVIVNRLSKEVIAEGYIYITVKDSQRFLIPNLITPNGDGLNDTWQLEFLAEYPNHRVTIFDRNGHIVLESTNYENDWDGTGYNKGSYVARTNLMNGVYTYVIELGDKNKTVLKSWIEIRANLNRRDYR